MGVRAYGQSDPLVEYRRESYILFQNFLGDFEKWLEENKEKLEIRNERLEMKNEGANNLISQGVSRSNISSLKKVGRNDPCPCGAKKSDGTPIKYKRCHGKNV